MVRRWSLRVRVFAALAISGALIVTVLGWHLGQEVSSDLDAGLRAIGREAARGLHARSIAHLSEDDPAGLLRLVRSELVRNPESRYAVVLDAEGRILAHSFPERVPDEVRLRIGATEPSGSVELRLDQEDVIDFWTRDESGAAHVGLSTSGVDAVRARIWKHLLVALAVAVLIHAGLTWYLTRPLERLVHAVARASEGGGPVLDPSLGDLAETEELAHRFDASFARLRDNLEVATRQREELKRLHEYLREVLDHLDLGVVRLDSEDLLEYANSAALALLGPALGDVSSALARLVPAEGKGEPPLAWSRRMPTGLGVFRDPAGKRFFRISVQAVQPPSAPGTRLITISDVTAERDVAAATERSRRMETLAGLASALAHEINTPLGVILMKSEMLLEESAAVRTESRWNEALRRIVAQSRRAGLIVRNMIFLSRQSTGRIPLRREPVPASEVVQEVVTLVRDRPCPSTVAIETCVDPPDLILEADAKAMEHLLLNLVNNALDALEGDPRPAGKPHVRLVVKGSGNEVILTVEDNGPGIAPAIGELLFEPFCTTKSDRGGAGLGLAICRAIAREHGGTIEVASGAVRGARFVVRLPHVLAAVGAGR